MNNHWEDYSKLCTCMDYTPYAPLGRVVAPTQPFGSCIHCWNKPLAQVVEEGTRMILDKSLRKEEIDFISTLSNQEVDKYLYGSWDNLQDDYKNMLESSMGVPKKFLGKVDN